MIYLFLFFLWNIWQLRAGTVNDRNPNFNFQLEYYQLRNQRVPAMSPRLLQLLIIIFLRKYDFRIYSEFAFEPDFAS